MVYGLRPSVAVLYSRLGVLSIDFENKQIESYMIKRI